MRTWLIILMLCVWPTMVAQVPAPSDTQLVHRYELSCGYSCAQELAIDLGQVTDKTSPPTVAMRFCSKESFPIALSTSAADYGYVMSILQDSYGYTPDRIALLRSPDCPGSHAGVTATEFWIVPKGKSLPESVELVTARSVHVNASLVETKADYRAALEKFKNALLDNSQAVGVVVGSYYQRPTPTLKRTMRIAEGTLRKSDNLRGRYFVKLARSTAEHSETARDPEYLKLFVIEIDKRRGMAGN